MNEWMNEWNNQSINQSRKEWMNERMNEWMNEWMRGWRCSRRHQSSRVHTVRRTSPQVRQWLSDARKDAVCSIGSCSGDDQLPMADTCQAGSASQPNVVQPRPSTDPAVGQSSRRRFSVLFLLLWPTLVGRVLWNDGRCLSVCLSVCLPVRLS